MIQAERREEEKETEKEKKKRERERVLECIGRVRNIYKYL